MLGLRGLSYDGQVHDTPAAIGCQVLPKAAIGAFTAAVGGPRTRFRYVLVEMSGRDPSNPPR